MNIAMKPPLAKSARAAKKSKRLAIDIATTKPGTPGGVFMRQFWICVYRSEDLPQGKARPIRIMSEDFTLYRGESGKAYCTDAACPHRWAMMHLGWVEGDDIRCVYHGWKFDGSGQCVEQPAEEPGFARKVRIVARETALLPRIEEITVMVSETEPPRINNGTACRFTKEGARTWMRYGRGPPSLTM